MALPVDELSRRRSLRRAGMSSKDTTPLELLELARDYLERNPGATSAIVLIEPPEDAEDQNLHILTADTTYRQAVYLLEVAKLSMMLDP